MRPSGWYGRPPAWANSEPVPNFAEYSHRPARPGPDFKPTGVSPSARRTHLGLRVVGRVAAIDLGSKRIGVASSDPTRTLASPFEVVERRGDLAADHRRLREIIDELEAELVVVGLPVSLNGTEGRAAELVRSELGALAIALGVPVEVFDERFTTVTAHRSLMANNMKSPARRRIVDKVAAAVMLQQWLDARSVGRSQHGRWQELKDFESETVAHEHDAESGGRS